ncbi:hypothetical protein H0H81_007944 [Sphagnurus paluster]|uniref:Uncharacterized protein n=1 Tax=Sphagnurus paluster TaxID=117069 RepID=A0A9P7K4U0_9AGAR|nr:hypothetical protein H0H81_007944 [Sphagnurus paluster]
MKGVRWCIPLYREDTHPIIRSRMAAPPRFMNSVYADFPDDDSTKTVYLQAPGLTYSGIGDRHVIVWWSNGCTAEARVTQVVQLTGQSGNYSYYTPVAHAQSSSSSEEQSEETNTQISLGRFKRAQRDRLLEVAQAVVYRKDSVVNGCSVWTRDLLQAAVGAGLLAQAKFDEADTQVPLEERRAEA